MQRAVSAAKAIGQVASGSRIYLHGDCAASLPLEEALAARALELTGIEVFQVHKDGPEVLADPALAGHVRIHSLFGGKGIRKAVAEGRADYIPVFLSDIPALIRNGTFPIDVAIVQLSWPDREGYCSLGISVDSAWQATQTATTVIAELNRQMPYTMGDARIHLDDLDAFIVTDRPLLTRVAPPADDVVSAIARHVAELVPDEATLQVGIGGIPDAVLAALSDKRDLGLHTEMFSDRAVGLMQSGVITHEAKTLDRGVAVVAFVAGTPITYGFVHENPKVQFRTTEYTNDIGVIRLQHRMTAINAALEVDLTGQVCADSIGKKIYSGIGGQVDFVRGATMAKDGKAIIALPSTAKGGTVSRIVAQLAAGAGVVTTRGHVQFVVTEYGVADLRGQPLAKRAERLAAIAHPDFRPDLRATTVSRRIFGP